MFVILSLFCTCTSFKLVPTTTTTEHAGPPLYHTCVHLVASASVSKGLLLLLLYNNVLSLRLLFLMRMMFLHVCVCVFLIIVLLHFHRFLVLFYFLIVYKFSPPLPRFLIFSISSSRSRLQMIVFFKKAFATNGGSISF